MFAVGVRVCVPWKKNFGCWCLSFLLRLGVLIVQVRVGGRRRKGNDGKGCFYFFFFSFFFFSSLIDFLF